MAGKTIIEISAEDQAVMLKELRRARYGYLLGLHVLLLCAAGLNPTLIAEVLFCSRASVYRIVEAYCQGRFSIAYGEDGMALQANRTTVLMPHIKRSLLALLKVVPGTFGWCRTRWSCATLALALSARRKIEVSAETVRRWLHEIGWVWKRAKLIAKDDDANRVSKLAKIRFTLENLGWRTALLFADELDIDLLPKVGYQWMAQGTQLEVMTPGKNRKRYLAGALDILTGNIIHCLASRKNNALFLNLLQLIDIKYFMFIKVYLVVDNYKIHKAKAVQKWLAEHPRIELLWLPTYCPRANPIERAFGDVHDKCTRNHKRARLSDLVKDVKDHLQNNGPWQYKLSQLYYDQAVTRAVASLAERHKRKAA